MSFSSVTTARPSAGGAIQLIGMDYGELKSQGLSEGAVSGRKRGTGDPVDETYRRRYDYYMKTLSPTQARANMTRLLDQAIAGHSIGITHKGRIVKLQPVPVTEDWAAEEYGLTSEQL